MKVALLQWGLHWEKKEKNIKVVERLAAQALEKEPDLIVLPEMFATGFSMHVNDIAEPPGGDTYQFLRELARNNRIYVVGGLVETGAGEKGRNTALAFSPEGELLGKYSKLHPFSYDREDKYYEPGEEVVLFDMAGFKTALFLCYDLRFPEIFRKARYDGASLFIVPANWPSARKEHWRTLLTARAIENQAFVLGVNRTGAVSEEVAYPGLSMAITPLGEAIATGGDQEAVVFATIDAAEVETVRKRFPFHEDARPDFYAKLFRTYLPDDAANRERDSEPQYGLFRARND